MKLLKKQRGHIGYRDEGLPEVEKPHYHRDEAGFLVACYHKCRTTGKDLFWWAVGLTVTFPIEHYIWEKLPGFRDITEWLGL